MFKPYFNFTAITVLCLFPYMLGAMNQEVERQALLNLFTQQPPINCYLPITLQHLTDVKISARNRGEKALDIYHSLKNSTSNSARSKALENVLAMFGSLLADVDRRMDNPLGTLKQYKPTVKLYNTDDLTRSRQYANTCFWLMCGKLVGIHNIKISTRTLNLVRQSIAQLEQAYTIGSVSCDPELEKTMSGIKRLNKERAQHERKAKRMKGEQVPGQLPITKFFALIKDPA